MSVENGKIGKGKRQKIEVTKQTRKKKREKEEPFAIKTNTMAGRGEEATKKGKSERM